MIEDIETVIIGAGQAGLATSYHLTQRRREHVVLEQAATAGNAWSAGRWDSFTLVSPNWSFRLPGAEYQGSEPGGFMALAEVVQRLQRYPLDFRLPVHYGETVTSVEKEEHERGYRVRTANSTWKADNVVVATGLFQSPKLPVIGKPIADDVVQLHSGGYRSPGALPEGSVLVVGSAQSGCQIAEELYQSGRKVFLSLGSAGRVPRRYRGRDIFEWLVAIGFLDRTVDALRSPDERFSGNPHATGRNGGHTLNLHQFARDGVVLLGKLQAGSLYTISLAPDHRDSLAKADALESEIIHRIDRHIDEAGIDAPPEQLVALDDGYSQPPTTTLDLKAAGITTIIWATGYRWDFSLVKLPTFDDRGFPVQQRGITKFPGLYFVGMPWLHTQKSGLLLGVGEDAAHIAEAIASSVA